MISKFARACRQVLSFFSWAIFSLAFAIFTISFSEVRAENFVLTEDVVKEIEKTLLFDKESRQKTDIYQQKAAKKSSYSINHSDKKDKDSDSNIGMIVVDPKVGNFDIREKEKLAYNSSLIGQYEVAIELYNQVVAAEPTNIYSKFALAVVYQKIGQFRQAKTIYYELLKSDAENKEEVIGNLLAILVEESPKDALYLLSRLTAENPQSSYILAQAALAYDKSKNYDQAISLLKRAISFEPNRADYKYNLAVIYDKTADYDNALTLYSDVMKGYDGVDQSIPAAQIKKRIEFLRNK